MAMQIRDRLQTSRAWSRVSPAQVAARVSAPNVTLSDLVQSLGNDGVWNIFVPLIWVRSRTLRVSMILVTAIWGMFVDGNVLPVLSPTTNSTIIQATTAAAFAVLGILFGPLAGAAGGLVRDGSIYLSMFIVHPEMVKHEGLGPWLGRAWTDIFEDMLLGLVPGLIGMRSRRFVLLILGAAVGAWISLPFLIAGDAIFAGQIDQLPDILTTVVGDWNEPVDPGLYVYALLAAAMAGAVITPLCSRRRPALSLSALLGVFGIILVLLGAHD